MAASTSTAVVEKEGDLCVAFGADPEGIRRRFHGEIFVTRFEASNG